jgi:hypothetical protein
MKKEKEEEKIKFNPDDYAYMDSMPLEGWTWEFIRRNCDYRKYYTNYCSELKKPLHERIYSFLHHFGMDVNRNNYYPLPEEKFLTIKGDVAYGIPNPDITFDDFQRHYSEKRKEHLRVHEEFLKIGNLKEYLEKKSIFANGKNPKEYREELEIYLKENCMPIILKSKIVKARKFNNHYLNRYKQLSNKKDIFKDTDFTSYCVHTLFTLAPADVEDTLYLGISLSAKKDDIIREIARILKYQKKPIKIKSPKSQKKNKNPLIGKSKIWKSYLIIYDLIKRERGMSFKDASDILSEYDESYAGEKVIERHYKAAEALINGDYKKFL